MEIKDFSNYEYSDRHGQYGGRAGDKDGAIDPQTGEYLIIKYPKSSRSLQGNDLPSYVSSPLSEYLGSHIYGILGYDVHDTELGWRNGQVVVACKDFCPTRGALSEMRTLKNAAYKELSKLTDEELPYSSSGDMVNLDELLLHLRVNPLLKDIPGLEERFWDTVVIDVYINNNDRNNGNWGILWDEKNRINILAPIFDNGNSFNNKWSEGKMESLVKNKEELERLALGARTAYERDGHVISAKKILCIKDQGMRDAIIRVVPNIQAHTKEIKALINSLPEYYRDKEVCNDLRKELYIDSLDIRLNKLLVPEYERLSHRDVHKMFEPNFGEYIDSINRRVDTHEPAKGTNKNIDQSR